MGLGRVELPTSRLSGVRSNHLSYRPYYCKDNNLTTSDSGVNWHTAPGTGKRPAAASLGANLSACLRIAASLNWVAVRDSARVAPLRDAGAYAAAKGVLLVTAAGNDGLDPQSEHGGPPWTWLRETVRASGCVC